MGTSVSFISNVHGCSRSERAVERSVRKGGGPDTIYQQSAVLTHGKLSCSVVSKQWPTSASRSFSHDVSVPSPESLRKMKHGKEEE